MVSKIDVKKFNICLNKNIKWGNPKVKGTLFSILTIFSKDKKTFYGNFNQLKFEITKNASVFPIPFIIYGKINTNKKEIIYDIKPIGFGYYWIKYFPFIGFLLFNLLLYTHSAPLFVFKIFNVFLLGSALISYFYLIKSKKRLLLDFKKVFELE
jgi:hypothetical protein